MVGGVLNVGIKIGEGLAVAAVVLFTLATAAYIYLTTDKESAARYLSEKKQKLDELFSDEEPSEVEECPVSGTRVIEEPGLPPGGAPEPPSNDPNDPIDVTIPIVIIVAAGAAGAGRQPVKPTNLSELDDKLWEFCKNLHDDYKATQSNFGTRSKRIKQLLDSINRKTNTPEDKSELCRLLRDHLADAQKHRNLRRKYVDGECDKFDWFNEGRTEAERRADHEEAIRQAENQINKLNEQLKKHCP